MSDQVEVVPHLCGGVAISEAVALTSAHPPQAHIQGREENRVVEVLSLRGHREQLEEPRSEDSVVDHIAVSGEVACCAAAAASITVAFCSWAASRQGSMAPERRKAKNASPATSALRSKSTASC